MFNTKVVMASKALAFAKQMADEAKGDPEAYWQSRDLSVAFPAKPRKNEQVLQELVRIGWIRSKRGPAGGYKLTVREGRKPVSALDVVQHFSHEDDAPFLPMFVDTLAAKSPTDIVNMLRFYQRRQGLQAA